jgi:Na+/proline symporter
LLDSVGFLPFWCSFLHIFTNWWFLQYFWPCPGSALWLFASALGRNSDPPLSPEFFVIKSSHSLKKDTRVARVGIPSVC